jgi:hypothetical protein
MKGRGSRGGLLLEEKFEVSTSACCTCEIVVACVLQVRTGSQNTRGIAYGDHVVGNGVGDHAGGANHAIAPDVFHDNSVCP